MIPPRPMAPRRLHNSPHSPLRSQRSARRSGLTLIELLVGVTLSLLLIFAVVQIFDWMGTTLTNERAMIELSGQLRAASQRLQEDLDHMTCRPVTPWVDSAHAKGYFQYQEGPETDAYFANGTQRVISFASDPDQLLATGDRDDLLAYTVYSETPLVGRVVDPATRVSHQIESSRAEVVWWAATVDVNLNHVADIDEPRVLLRRQFLMRPDLAAATLNPELAVMLANTHATDFMFLSEVSFGHGILNDLGTTTRPVNRIGYYNDAAGRNLFPSLLQQVGDPYDDAVNGQRVPTLEQYGRFVVLSDVLAFDVRAYDPRAPIVVLNAANDAFAVTPSDPGYPNPAATWDTTNDSRIVGRGAYVDLHYLNRQDFMDPRVSLFSGGPHLRPSGGYSALINGTATPSAPIATYTTWPLDYERDGVDQDGDSLFDEGFNGVDDDQLNGVDDMIERETTPPYPYPLRGIEVRLRMEDFSTRQVRQASVVGDFQTD